MFNLTNQHWTSNIQTYFAELQNTEADYRFDVTLISDDKQMLKAHKFVLCAGSLFFREMFKFAHNNSSPLLYIRGASESTLENILHYLYHGEVNIDQVQLEDFVKVSNDLEIIGMGPLSSEPTKEKGCFQLSDGDAVVYSEISKAMPRTYENMDKSMISRVVEEKLDVKMNARSRSYLSMDHIYTDIDKQDTWAEESDRSLSAKADAEEIQSNLSEGRVECNLCNKTFKNKNSLKVHKYRYHTGEKILQESLIIMT